ncbi:TlpA family protein disulfide reductase [Salinimicrobium xinjiangense]|uniref:TlpA family protein disulfide reductase n=1 Tax=Salinimicrobium xinjiangense TaxID=438596 RepID=UPI0006877BA4|nr:TlpA disulfide reductase family protein [Salinimicrobium xinjiangense]
MKPFLHSSLLFLFSLFVLSCGENEKISETELTFSNIHSDQAKWWRYHKTNIDLSSEFTARGEEGDTLSKKAFFEALLTGDYIALKLKSNASENKYKLFRLQEDSDDDISYTIMADTYPYYKHFMMEGKEFPDFEFTDLQGRKVSKELAKGKTLAVKTWFIRCKPCIEEMPQLNRLVEEYENRDDVLFLSLSLDPKEELETFLSTREFKYPVIANQKAFIEDTLGFTIYPTHIIVEPSGKIRKVVNTAPEMIAALKNTAVDVPDYKDAPPPLD